MSVPHRRNLPDDKDFQTKPLQLLPSRSKSIEKGKITK